MPFVVITNPTVGETLKLDTYGTVVVDNLNFLNDQIVGSTSGQVLNGSFETGSGADTAPTSWDLVITSGNTTAFETSAANTDHGKQAFSMTTPGSISGGVTLTTTDFITVAPTEIYEILFYMKASIATTSVQVSFEYFTEAETAVSTDTVYNDSATNPTAWTRKSFLSTVPATAKLMKISIVGVNNTTAASCYFDGVSIALRDAVEKMSTYTASGSFVVPFDVTSIGVEMVGGGGGGDDDGGSNAGAGGGAGGFVKETKTVTPGATLTVTVGAAGAVAGNGGNTGVTGFTIATGGTGASTLTAGTGGTGTISGGDGVAAGAVATNARPIAGGSSAYGSYPAKGAGGIGKVTAGGVGVAGIVFITYKTKT